MSRRRRALVTWGGGLRYLFKAVFGVDDAAPLTDPYVDSTSYSFDVHDTGNKAAVASSWMGWGSSTANANPMLVGQTNLYPALKFPGGAVAFRWRSGGGRAQFGLANSANASGGLGIRFTTYMDANAGSLNGGAITQRAAYVADNTIYWCAFVMRTTGVHCFIKGGAWTDWTLVFTHPDATLTSAATALYPFMLAIGTTSDFDFDTVAVAEKLSGSVASGTGFATAYQATSAANDTLVMEANALVEWTLTAATGQTQELSIRRTDDNNRIVVRCAQATSTIKLIKINGGVETELASGSQTWTNGTAYRVLIKANAGLLEAGVENVTPISATDTFNATVTGVKVSHNGGILAAWPLVSAAASAQLNALIAPF